MDAFETEVADTAAWFSTQRFDGVTRLYSPRQVVEQRGTIRRDYSIAKNASAGFFDLLRDLFKQGKSITTFGPYSPGQAVQMVRSGIRGIYLGGWATSAKGSKEEDPGSDLASYPLSQVPDEAASLVRALLAADKNQTFARSRMTDEERANAPEVDFRPFIIADADTGHGGDAHVRNLIRRFVEVGVTGYHIEDQKPGTKKCGHQGGKVLVPVDEQIKRLNTARFQLDVMEVPGIIVARTDAESATLLESANDDRDHPFVLGATNPSVPHYKYCHLAMLKYINEAGNEYVNGHLLYRVPDAEYAEAHNWLKSHGILDFADQKLAALKSGEETNLEKTLDSISSQFVGVWEEEAGIKTYGEAVADRIVFRTEEGEDLGITPEAWLEFAARASYHEAKKKANSLGLEPHWDASPARTLEGFYQIRGGIDYSIAKSLAVAPFADLLWMETKTADLKDAKVFAEAIHAKFPDQMLAYNLSPSFSWDTTGMSDEEMKAFPEELGKLGFVFNFITYGGHQVDGLASEEFAADLNENGMLALAKLQRKLRLLNSPYKTPQTLVGGPRIDGALTASSGRTATTKAMGKGSTQFQHMIQTEVPPSVLEGWLDAWATHYKITEKMSVRLRPHSPGSDLLELRIEGKDGEIFANIVFAHILDRSDRHIMSVRDQNNFREDLRQKRLMTLMHLFAIHRYDVVSVHYVTPTDDNQKQAAGMKDKLGIFDSVTTEIGDIIVASVNTERVRELLSTDGRQLEKFISKA